MCGGSGDVWWYGDDNDGGSGNGSGDDGDGGGNGKRKRNVDYGLINGPWVATNVWLMGGDS